MFGKEMKELQMKEKAGKDFFFLSQQDRTDSFDFFYGLYPEFLNTSNFPQQFFPIVSLFAEDSNYNITKLHTENGKLFLKSDYETETETKINELMLRYRANGNLIVARVQFIHQRVGKMTKLFELLKNIKSEYGLDRIIIESVQSESMYCWCLKNKLKLVDGDPHSYEFK